MKAPLWRCPKCRRVFANENQSHACGRHTLDDLDADFRSWLREAYAVGQQQHLQRPSTRR